MELGETIEDTARREVFEETGLRLGDLQLFGIYSGNERTFGNGDQASLVQILFSCRDYSGELLERNSESLEIRFFPLDALPENLFPDHISFFNDMLSGEKPPFVR